MCKYSERNVSLQWWSPRSPYRPITTVLIKCVIVHIVLKKLLKKIQQKNLRATPFNLLISFLEPNEYFLLYLKCYERQYVIFDHVQDGIGVVDFIFLLLNDYRIRVYESLNMLFICCVNLFAKALTLLLCAKEN